MKFIARYLVCFMIGAVLGAAGLSPLAGFQWWISFLLLWSSVLARDWGMKRP